MAQFPTNTQLVNSVNTVLAQKTYVGDQADAISQLFGSADVSATVIATGSITPSSGMITVDTEASAATDDLSNILTTNLHDGAVIAVASLNAGRVVTAKHNAGGAGQITLVDATDRDLETDKYLLLQRSGTDWLEFALNSEPIVDVVTTRGDIIVGNISGDSSRLAVGTVDQVLTSDGTDAAWSDASGGGGMWEFVSKADAASATTVEFTALSGDNDYMVVVDNLVAVTNAVNLLLRYGTGGGPTWESTANYAYNGLDLSDNAATTDHRATGATSLNILTGISNAAAQSSSGELILSTAADSGIYHKVHSRMSSSAVPFLETIMAGHTLGITAAITGLQFLLSTGNFTSGTLELWKRAKQ